MIIDSIRNRKIWKTVGFGLSESVWMLCFMLLIKFLIFRFVDTFSCSTCPHEVQILLMRGNGAPQSGQFLRSWLSIAVFKFSLLIISSSVLILNGGGVSIWNDCVLLLSELPQKRHSSLTNGICAPQNGQCWSSSLVYDFKRLRRALSMYVFISFSEMPLSFAALTIVCRSTYVNTLSLNAKSTNRFIFLVIFMMLKFRLKYRKNIIKRWDICKKKLQNF